MEIVLGASGGRVFWVAQGAGNASDSNPGTQAQPWRTIGKAASVMQARDSVIVRAGTYRETIKPSRGGGSASSRITYAAFTGEKVIVSGADLATAWTRQGDAWTLPWTVSLCSSDTSNNLFRREMIIFDGKALMPVFSRSAVVPGTFYVAGSSCAPTAIYARFPKDAAPTGHTVEAAKRDPLFSPGGGVGWLRVIGFTFRYAANRPQYGAVQPGTTGSLIEENTVEWTNGRGMDTTGKSNVFRGNKFNDNGQIGMGGSCDSCIVEYNQTLRNNWKGFNISWEAGGMKFSNTTNTILRNHEAGDNYGNGIWFDINNHYNTIENCVTYRNLQFNIYLELNTTNTLVKNNTSFGAKIYTRSDGILLGGNAISLYGAHHNKIFNNTFYSNERGGFYLRRDERAPNGYNEIYNNIFANNATNMTLSGAEITIVANSLSEAQTNKFDGNLYWHPNTDAELKNDIFHLKYPSTPNQYYGNDLVLWRGLIRGDWSAKIADPKLDNLTDQKGWHITSASPARELGVSTSTAVNSDIEGDPRPAGGGDAGADQYLATSAAVVVTPLEDGFVKAGSSTYLNFGGDQQLKTKLSQDPINNRHAYLKFDISTLQAGKKVTLRLFGNHNATSDGPINVELYSSPDDSWSEYGLTWNGKPATGVNELDQTTISGVTPKWYEWDLTSYFNAEKNAGRNIITLVLKNTTTSIQYTSFSSRDAAANKPQLVIVP